MRAILVTELERAIIDNLRTRHIMFECIVCNTAELPNTEEGIKYMHECLKSGGEEAIIEFEKRQEQYLKEFRAAGYGDVVEVGNEKTKPHLQIEAAGRL